MGPAAVLSQITAEPSGRLWSFSLGKKVVFAAPVWRRRAGEASGVRLHTETLPTGRRPAGWRSTLRSMRRLLVFALVLVGVGVLGFWAIRVNRSGGVAAIAPAADRLRPQGDYYVLAVQQEPTHFNPLTTSDLVAESCVLAYTHDTLLGLDGDSGELVPRLASSWEAMAADGRTFELELRADVVFANGDPVTMADVLFPWELACAGHALPGSLWSVLSEVERIEAVGGRRLRIVLRHRHFSGLARMATAYRVVHRGYFENQARRLARVAGDPEPVGIEDPRFARALLEIELPGPGTGPYRLGVDAESGEPLWNRGVDVTLVRNNTSWHREAEPAQWNLAGLRVLFQADPAARRAALRREEVDFIEDPKAAETLRADSTIAASYGAHSYTYRTLGPWFVVWNHEHEALGDARVRRALTMLFDRERIAELLVPRAVPPVSWFRPGSPRHAGHTPLPHDIEAARALLAEAGYGPGRTLSLGIIVDKQSLDHDAIMELAIPAFRQAGVVLEKVGMTFSVFQERLRTRAFDGFFYLWNPDPWNDPHQVFHSSQAVAGRDNWMRYRSEPMDAVLEQARVELDESRRRALYGEFCRIFRDDQPVTLLYHQRLSALLHRRFRGVVADQSGLSPRRWWVELPDQLHHWGVVEPR